MVRSSLRYVLPVLVCSLILSLAYAGDAPATATYARLALPPNGAQVLLIKLRSDGTCKLRNVAFVDRDCDGQFEPGEKCTGKVREQSRGQYLNCMFPPVTIALPTGGDCTGQNVLTLQSMLFQRKKGPASENSYAMIRSDFEQGGTKWEYMGYCMVQPNASQDAAARGATAPLKLNLATQPDQKTPGNTGLSVALMGPEFGLYEAKRDGQPCQVSLKVTGPDGTVVHEAQKPLPDLAGG